MLKICGIICEYNPFHNGHMYQIEEARRISGADYVIVVMSGDFVQRGEPAMFNKWARTKMALNCGADMVLELPTVFALSSAEFFASGAVDVLKKTGIVTHISFGSETYDGQTGAIALQKIANKTLNGPIVNRESLKSGVSFAAASRNSEVALPNDILAAEYLRAIQRFGAKVEIVPIKRKGNGHTGEGSAMFIRSLLSKENLAEVQRYMPTPAFEILKREINEGRGPIRAEDFSNIILADLRRLGVEGLREKPFISEGLEYKIYSAACENGSFVDFVSDCTSKRYTSSRIRRIAFATMLGIQREMLNETVPYIRILGMRRSCGELMDLLNSNAEVPIITSKAKFMNKVKNVCDNIDIKAVMEFLKVENNAANVYSLLFRDTNSRTGDSEMTHPLVFVD